MKLSKNSIYFKHPSISAWTGETHYKTCNHVKRALANLKTYVPDNVKPDLQVFYRFDGGETYEYTDF